LPSAIRRVTVVGVSELMDIVVGDFGRPGTLRYLQAFSDRERELITAELPAEAEFLDEHRLVQLTVLGQLRVVKRDILAPFLERGRPLDASVMVGTSIGASVEAIVPRLGALLGDQLTVAAKHGVGRVRVVIPCNTLGPVAEPLERALQDPATELGLDLGIAPMPPLVAAELRDRGSGPVRVLGTPSSVAAYRAELDVLDNPEELTRAYERCINDAIRGVAPTPAALEVVQRYTAAQDVAGGAVLEACTDVNLDVGLDALEIYAARLAREAYHGR
jgi:hypothetical protein